MDQAVAVRLPDHSSPISTTLSSGFDSSTVTGTAARLVASPNLLTAYTSAPPANDRLLLPPGRFADETPTAAETANILGIKHKIVRDSTPILSSIRGLSHYFQAPLPNPFNFSWMRAILDDVRQSGQSTILVAGEGNFTISYGGREILSALVRRGRWLRWFSETREVLRVHTHLRWRGALYGSFEPFLPPAVIRLLQVAFDRREYLSEFDFINPALRSDAPPPVVLSGDLLTDRAALLALHDDGERFKAMAALTGVEERDPTIDRRLVDFCLSLEPEHLLCRGEPRPLAREAFSDRVNPRVFDPSTRGYQSADWYARLHKSEALDTLEHIRNSSAAELLDLTKLQVAIERWPAFDTNAYATLFSFGRNVSQALNFGLFVVETERQSGRS
jgi:asparagine synthase (glutamine-hydrolysing)